MGVYGEHGLTGEKDHPPMESSTFKLLNMVLAQVF